MQTLLGALAEALAIFGLILSGTAWLGEDDSTCEGDGGAGMDPNG